MNAIRNFLNNGKMQIVNAVTPIPKVSQFENERILTPAEFVEAGDFLVQAFPSWEWAGGDEKKARKYLPSDKQYLITRKVPCKRRCSEIQRIETQNLADNGGEEDGWVETTMAGPGGPSSSTNQAVDDDEEKDEQAVAPQPVSGRLRRYDLHITYDLYNRVPQFWLVGFANDATLGQREVYEDVSSDHIDRTITWDVHPHHSYRAASVHPCNHANVMKKLGDMIKDEGRKFTIDQYMLTFLKFIQGIVPTIEYDYTMSV